LYNPEFGPYNGITAQGWTSSPGFGACQGAWGGSNACIVNSDGVPGQSTVGLVANANGGGPSPTGGTTSGTAGGYNNSMTTTNAGTGATAGAPPAPTVTSTTTTYSTNTSTSGNTRTTTSTPTTVTRYSDGTSTTTTGTPTVTTVNRSAVTSSIISQYVPTSYNSPGAEQALKAFDSNASSKYLNFDKFNAGVTIHLTTAKAVSGMTFTTANDFPGRDPTAYTLYASNDGVNWTLIAYNQQITLSDNRVTVSDVYNVNNTTAYYYYFITFPNTKAGVGCGLNCNSMQIGEITFYYWPDASTTATDTGNGNIYNPGTYNANIVGGSTTGSTSAEMNVAASGSESIFVWQGNSGSGWNDVLLVRPGWYWTCSTCAVTSGTVSSVIYDGNGDSIYFYINDTDGNNVFPDSGSWYSFSSTAPVIYSSEITTGQQTQLNNALTRLNNVTGNKIYLEVSNGSGNSVTINQIGNKNLVQNINGSVGSDGLSRANINGSNNTVRIDQGNGLGISANIIEFTIMGTGNNYTARQGYNWAADRGGHYQGVTISGTNNTITNTQTNNGSGGHFIFQTVNGNSNTSTITQSGNNSKGVWTGILGNQNTQSITQSGLGNHYLDITLVGDSNNATIIQTGDVTNKATISLTNAGGPSTLNLNQSSTSGNPGAVYSIQQQCATTTGCSVTVNQTK
jgi:hypothetical protein